MNNVVQKIKENDPWYVESQLDQIKNFGRVIRKRWKFILSTIESFRNRMGQKTLKILDAGCGDGVNLKVLTQISNAEIYGIDYNPLRVERAKREFPQAKIFQMDLIKLQMNDKFDIILCNQVLEHIKEDEMVLKNLYKILKDDGIMILGVPNEGCLLAQLRNRFIQPYIQRTTDHINFYKEKEIRAKIESARFQIEEIMYEGFFFPHLRINLFFASFEWGFRFINLLGRILKSQVGGYYFILCKKSF